MAKRTGGFIGQDGINAPDPATGVTGTAGNAQVTVSWTAPSDVGGAAITGYSVQSTDGSGTWQSSYDLETASYDSVSFNVGGQEPNAYGLAFNSDGTKMFIAGFTFDEVHQFSLSSGFDLSTASYDSVSFSVASQTLVPRGLVFNNDGTKMYVCTDDDSDSIYQYSLSSGFDLSTASYDSVSFSVASQETSIAGLRFNTDGTKLYIVGWQNNTVYQYSLSSAFVVSSASYDSVSFSVATQASIARDVIFNPSGTKMYIVDGQSDSLYQYSLSSAFVVSSASYDSVSFSFNSQDSNPQAAAFNNDGTKLFMVGTANDAVYQYTSGLSDYPTASPVTVTGLSNGTSYTFNVRAINPFGWSSPSDASGAVTPENQGQELFDTAGTYSWVAPAGVTSVSVVAIGGGGGGAGTFGSSGGANGGGAGLSYGNNISVVPGNSYTVVVGAMGTNGGLGQSGGNGGDSSFINSSTLLGGGGGGGTGGTGGGSRGTGGGTERDGGGLGGFGSAGTTAGGGFGGGGGGAGGYSGNGGNGAVYGTNGQAGSGGGGGGGTSNTGGNGYGLGGGGVGAFGEGTSGAGGVSNGNRTGGNGSVNIGNGTAYGRSATTPGAGTYAGSAYGGTSGAVRIIWPGTTRAFPSTNTEDV